MENGFLASSPADHQCIVPGRCRALMNGPVLSINRSARPVGAHAKQQPALKYTAHKYTNCALQCILYTVNRAERRQSIENARSGEEQSGERLYSSSSSGMRWRLATKILSGPGTNPIEVQDFCADLLNIAPTSFSFAPPPVRLQFMVVRPR